MSNLEENLYTGVPLSFKDGRFKIFCISDLHGVVNYDRRIIRDLDALLDYVKPDLLMVLGDIVWEDAMQSKENMLKFVSPVFNVVERKGIPEYVITYKNTAESYYEGTRREAVGCPPINSRLFNAMVDRGDIKTVVCGHDHINDFTGSFLGIRLCNDAGLNYDGYCADDLRGGRVIEIDESDPWHIKTYMVRSAECVRDYPGVCIRADRQ